MSSDNVESTPVEDLGGINAYFQERKIEDYKYRWLKTSDKNDIAIWKKDHMVKKTCDQEKGYVHFHTLVPTSKLNGAGSIVLTETYSKGKQPEELFSSDLAHDSGSGYNSSVRKENLYVNPFSSVENGRTPTRFVYYYKVGCRSCEEFEKTWNKWISDYVHKVDGHNNDRKMEFRAIDIDTLDVDKEKWCETYPADFVSAFRTYQTFPFVYRVDFPDENAWFRIFTEDDRNNLKGKKLHEVALFDAAPFQKVLDEKCARDGCGGPLGTSCNKCKRVIRARP